MCTAPFLQLSRYIISSGEEFEDYTTQSANELGGELTALEVLYGTCGMHLQYSTALADGKKGGLAE